MVEAPGVEPGSGEQSITSIYRLSRLLISPRPGQPARPSEAILCLFAQQPRSVVLNYPRFIGPSLVSTQGVGFQRGKAYAAFSIS